MIVWGTKCCIALGTFPLPVNWSFSFLVFCLFVLWFSTSSRSAFAGNRSRRHGSTWSRWRPFASPEKQRFRSLWSELSFEVKSSPCRRDRSGSLYTPWSPPWESHPCRRPSRSSSDAHTSSSGWPCPPEGSHWFDHFLDQTWSLTCILFVLNASASRADVFSATVCWTWIFDD